MEEQKVKDPLVELYGPQVLEELAVIVNELKDNSNIPFDTEYVRTGVAFMRFKAQDTLDGTRKKQSLKDLTSESFGEAAIAKYNV